MNHNGVVSGSFLISAKRQCAGVCFDNCKIIPRTFHYTSSALELNCRAEFIKWDVSILIFCSVNGVLSSPTLDELKLMSKVNGIEKSLFSLSLLELFDRYFQLISLVWTYIVYTPRCIWKANWFQLVDICQ